MVRPMHYPYPSYNSYLSYYSYLSYPFPRAPDGAPEGRDAKMGAPVGALLALYHIPGAECTNSRCYVLSV